MILALIISLFAPRLFVSLTSLPRVISTRFAFAMAGA